MWFKMGTRADSFEHAKEPLRFCKRMRNSHPTEYHLSKKEIAVWGSFVY